MGFLCTNLKSVVTTNFPGLNGEFSEEFSSHRQITLLMIF